MKQIGLEKAVFEICINEAQRERVILTRKGKPVALIVGLEGMNMEQLEFGSSDKFWKLITTRRIQKTITREELEAKLKLNNME
jgi:antitoxin (DNA-binding transcriptional repressor) of toxin-antitoxin stability system